MTDASDLGEYLRKAFFAAWVKPTYENRPIYLPLSSEKKSFVAWVSIHRFRHDTLQVLLAEHLRPEATRLEGQLADLANARVGKMKVEAELPAGTPRNVVALPDVVHADARELGRGRSR